MQKQTFTRPTARLLLCCLLLHFTLLLTACGGATAAAMHLKKAEGAVGVADGEGNKVAPEENLGLYSGYTVATEAESYAWIDLDAAKLAKLDAESAVEIVQDGKQLTVNVQTGGLFFNVTEPLADDETLEIATSSLLVGIRGTCGWVTQTTAALLEGTVTVTAGEQAVTVNAGEMAVITESGALEVKPFSAAAVPGFVRAEVAADEQLAAQVLEAAGMDFSEYIPAAQRAEEVIAKRLDEVLYREWVDFEGDGDPELLVLGIQPHDELRSGVVFYIFAEDPRAYSPSDANRLDDYLSELWILDSESDTALRWSLVESGGKMFIEVDRIYQDDTGPVPGDPDPIVTSETVTYFGFDAEGNWFGESAGCYTTMEGKIFPQGHYFLTYNPTEEHKYFVESDTLPTDDYAQTRARYSLVKQLLNCPDGATVTVTAP